MASTGKNVAVIAGATAVALAAAGAVTAGLFLPAATGSTAVVQAQAASIATPTAIAGPTPPAGSPYSSVALLRGQRMSFDVIPDAVLSNTNSSGPVPIADSARLVASHGNDRVWLTANSEAGLCLVSGTVGQDGANTGCTSGSPTDPPAAAGTEISGTGFGDGFDAVIVADGTPVAGAIKPGYRQVASNVWLKAPSSWTPPARASVGADPFAFPLAKPYSRYAILRRAATARDALPKPSADGTDVSLGVIVSSVRLAGRSDGVTVWVGVNTEGGVCMVTSNKSGTADASSCGDPKTASGVGFSDDTVQINLEPDGQSSGALPAGSHRLGTNVVVAPAN